MPPLILRSLTLDKEQAAILRVAIAALQERGLLSPDGRDIARDLAERIDTIIDTIEHVERQAPYDRTARAKDAGLR